MANFNKVMMMGNLTRDPDVKFLTNGTAVCSLTIASNRVYKPKDGEKKEEVTFMRVVVWGKRAEVCGEYLSKGSSVFVEGRLQNRSWEGLDGEKKHAVEIVANNVQFLGGKKGTNNGVNQEEAPPDIDTPPAGQKSEVPF